MELLLIIFAVLISIVGLFLLVEYPYHFIGIFIFIIHYQYNIDLPGPLDLRGIISLVLLIRLIFFDKENLDLLLHYLTKHYLFILIIIFELYFIALTFVEGGTYKKAIRLLVFQVIGLLLGFLAVYRGYAVKSFFTAIITAGFFATADLIYSFGISSQLFVRRLLDIAFKSEYSTELNHNFFGMLNGIALILTYIRIVSKKIDIKKGLLMLLIFGSGILLSTSRGALLTTIFSVIISTFLLPRDQIDTKKIFSIGIKGFFVLIIIISSYIFLLSVLKVNTEFTDKIYYRLVEEPIELLQGKTSTFRGENQFRKEGSASWRLNKALRDIDKFTSLPISVQLFGYGYNGYYRVGEKGFDNYDMRIQNASHNGIVEMITERGYLGFLLFIIISYLLIKESLKTFKLDVSNFPFFIIVIYMTFSMTASATLLLSRFGYLIIGGTLGQILFSYYSQENEVQPNIKMSYESN